MSSENNLAMVLSYEADLAKIMFSRKYNIDSCETNILFTELKKFLWFLSIRPEESQPFPIFPEQRIIDDFWHEFILSTKEYHYFCQNFLGRYIHHVPTPDGVLTDGSSFGVHRNLLEKDREKYINKNLELFNNSMLEVKKYLGIETVKLWYQIFPEKYYK